MLSRLSLLKNSHERKWQLVCFRFASIRKKSNDNTTHESRIEFIIWLSQFNFKKWFRSNYDENQWKKKVQSHASFFVVAPFLTLLMSCEFLNLECKMERGKHFHSILLATRHTATHIIFLSFSFSQTHNIKKEKKNSSNFRLQLKKISNKKSWKEILTTPKKTPTNLNFRR